MSNSQECDDDILYIDNKEQYFYIYISYIFLFLDKYGPKPTRCSYKLPRKEKKLCSNVFLVMMVTVLCNYSPASGVYYTFCILFIYIFCIDNIHWRKATGVLAVWLAGCVFFLLNHDRYRHCNYDSRCSTIFRHYLSSLFLRFYCNRRCVCTFTVWNFLFLYFV